VRPPLDRLDHVGIAVHDMTVAQRYFRDTLQLPVVGDETADEVGVRLLYLDAGNVFVQLVQPVREGPVSRWLDARGEGLHHIAYRVDDCAVALEAMKAAGATAIDQAPRPGSRGTTVAFIHPKGAFGTLIELVEE